MAHLEGHFVRTITGADWPQGEVVLFEENGDQYVVLCMAQPECTHISGQQEAIDYLNKRYGSQMVCFAARNAVLSRLSL